MENMYKIRNFPGVKLESVGLILTEKQVIESFNSEHVECDSKSIQYLIDSKFIDKSNERIELDFDSNNGVVKKGGISLSIAELETCEKVLSGDMVEKEVINKWMTKWAKADLKCNCFAECQPELYGILNNTPNWLQSDEKVSKEARKVTLTDTGTIRNSWDEKTKHPVDGDVLITTDLAAPFGEVERINEIDCLSEGEKEWMLKKWGRELFTSEQMIEKVKEWHTSNRIQSFEKFINSKQESDYEPIKSGVEFFEAGTGRKISERELDYRRKNSKL